MLIDLGEDREDPQELDSPQWTAGWRPFAALIALVPALALTAAGPGPTPAMTVRANLELGPSQELVAFSGKEIIVRDGRMVNVFEPDGRERWRATLTNVQDVFFRVDVAQNRVLALAQRLQVPRTVAFDLATGARVWEFEGWAETFNDLILVFSPDGDRLAVYDARTQAEKWSLEGLVAQTFDPVAHTVLAFEKSGKLTEYDLETGSVIRSGKVDLPPGNNYGIAHVGGSLTIFSSGPGTDEPKMLTLDRWTFAPQSTVTPQPEQAERYDCGPVVCEAGFDGGRVSILDKKTGARLWETRSGVGVTATPAGLYTYPLFEAGSIPLELLDPWTGQLRASLEGWQPVTPDDRYNDRAPVVLRQVHTTGSEGQTFIAGFDRTGLRVLGSLPHVIYSCRYADWVLACVTGDRRLLVVEINSGRWQA